jgi:hypothetical protein
MSCRWKARIDLLQSDIMLGEQACATGETTATR